MDTSKGRFHGMKVRINIGASEATATKEFPANWADNFTAHYDGHYHGEDQYVVRRDEDGVDFIRAPESEIEPYVIKPMTDRSGN
jgi:hypothetical protein|tara:strand:- start:17282 stop:17533 length:252 start_codon:yes stop_codon:yes gene_type:complete